MQDRAFIFVWRSLSLRASKEINIDSLFSGSNFDAYFRGSRRHKTYCVEITSDGLARVMFVGTGVGACNVEVGKQFESLAKALEPVRAQGLHLTMTLFGSRKVASTVQLPTAFLDFADSNTFALPQSILERTKVFFVTAPLERFHIRDITGPHLSLDTRVPVFSRILFWKLSSLEFGVLRHVVAAIKLGRRAPGDNLLARAVRFASRSLYEHLFSAPIDWAKSEHASALNRRIHALFGLELISESELTFVLSEDLRPLA